jgi:hypothetical protein
MFIWRSRGRRRPYGGEFLDGGRDAEFGMLYYFLEDNDYCGRNLLQFCGIDLRVILENVPIYHLNLFSTWVEEASGAENLPELYSCISELYGSASESDFRFLLEMSNCQLATYYSVNICPFVTPAWLTKTGNRFNEMYNAKTRQFDRPRSCHLPVKSLVCLPNSDSRFCTITHAR